MFGMVQNGLELLTLIHTVEARYLDRAGVSH